MARLHLYDPTSKQVEFHAAGALARERLFLAGNQLGKTTAGALELAMHLTGDYPPWWQGRRFLGPVVAWAAGVSGESTRDNPQRLLLGRPGAPGTGAIPRAAIGPIAFARGIAGLVDTAQVRHRRGGRSLLSFKTYGKGRQKWAGETIDLVWFDEEPGLDIYTEGLTRTNRTQGLVYATLTPLMGRTALIDRFLGSSDPSRTVVQFALDQATQYTPEERMQLASAYPEHEREARARGVPLLGEGRVFTADEAAIAYDAGGLSRHWRRIGGIDFGIGHPTAAVWMAHDPDTDCAYVFDAYRAADRTIEAHATVIRGRHGGEVPFAWPKDGAKRSELSGAPIAEEYRKRGLAMLAEHATHEEGGDSLGTGILLMQERLVQGRLRVARHLTDWFEEYRLYHRKGGLVVAERDDLLSATRYALMMLRRAATPPARAGTRPRRTDGEYNPFNW